MCWIFAIALLCSGAVAQTEKPLQIEELKAYQQRLNSIWQSVKTDAALARLRRFASEFDEADSKLVVADQVSKAVGITFRGKTDEQRVKAAPRYLKAAVTVLDEKADLIVDVSKDRSYRGRALGYLGVEAPHPAYLPLLRLIVASKHEPRYVRYGALTAISQIPHDTVVEDLIAYLEIDDLGGRAWEQLGKLTRSGILFGADDREAMRAEYLRWWKKNKKTFKYDRMSVLWEY